MKAVMSILIILVTFNKCHSQTIPSQVKIEGVWRFVSSKRGYDPNFICTKENKIIEITYWSDTQKASLYGSPYSYYGFWDDASGIYPKKVTELKSVGNRVLFYDDLGKSYDSLGNLIKYTRSCYLTYSPEGDDEVEMSSNYIPNKLYLNFTGKDPDVYERIREIPLFVIEALRRNEKDWLKFKSFVKFNKTSNKTFIYSSSKVPTKMYLIKGDEVEVLEEQGEWLKIRYYGKKTIEGWIKRSDVD
ncbi:SH3 domain-containing protein [Flectobacillus sp. DC10W]|uniref:SH3 domain-containing protein n=1 Tax=Flectobacillus longus TaxID=2984207 RepID=A0ABT6YTF0_9BACT|nr:SH3 domain-containing protein [Flectobacillus longus]MDI9866835.1 SH3 domain-containing protein [Flectobacillus longus]